MSRIPLHSGKDMVAALEKAGFTIARQKGSHVCMVKSGVSRPVVVPLHAELEDHVVANNLRTAGISRKRYLELLGRRRGKS